MILYLRAYSASAACEQAVAMETILYTDNRVNIENIALLENKPTPAERSETSRTITVKSGLSVKTVYAAESGPGSLWLLQSYKLYDLCKRISKLFLKGNASKVDLQPLKCSLARPNSWVHPADRWASECLISYCASWIAFWCESIGYGTETIEKSPFSSPFRHKKLWRSPQKGFVFPLWTLVSNSVDFLLFQKRWVKLMNLMNSPQHKSHSFGIWTFPKADGQVSKLFQAVCTQMWQSV